MRLPSAAVAVALLLGMPASSRGQTSPAPIPGNRPAEWGIAAGYGPSVRLNRGRSQERVLLFEPSLGVRLGRRLEYIVEGHVSHYFAPSGYMVGVMPVGARLYLGGGRVLPYVSIGAGLGWTNLQRLDEIDQRFNFLLQGSLGLREALSETRAWTIETRLAHVSDAGMTVPNLGLNSAVLLLGLRFR